VEIDGISPHSKWRCHCFVMISLGASLPGSFTVVFGAEPGEGINDRLASGISAKVNGSPSFWSRAGCTCCQLQSQLTLIFLFLFMGMMYRLKADYSFKFSHLYIHMNKQSRHKTRWLLFLVYRRMFPHVLGKGRAARNTN
jgi:hypothetical protein